jgi:hypothetical protein
MLKLRTMPMKSGAARRGQVPLYDRRNQAIREIERKRLEGIDARPAAGSLTAQKDRPGQFRLFV